MMDLEIVRVDRGEKEQIVLKVARDCNLWPYIIFDTTYGEEGGTSNVYRHSFIFPNLNVSAGDYVVIRTRKGETESFKNRAKTNTYIFYWGFDEGVKLWNKEGDKALIVKVEEYNFVSL